MALVVGRFFDTANYDYNAAETVNDRWTNGKRADKDCRLDGEHSTVKGEKIEEQDILRQYILMVDVSIITLKIIKAFKFYSKRKFVFFFFERNNINMHARQIFIVVFSYLRENTQEMYEKQKNVLYIYINVCTRICVCMCACVTQITIHDNIYWIV